MRISDWSSDVCSSDLKKPTPILDPPGLDELTHGTDQHQRSDEDYADQRGGQYMDEGDGAQHPKRHPARNEAAPARPQCAWQTERLHSWPLESGKWLGREVGRGSGRESV